MEAVALSILVVIIYFIIIYIFGRTNKNTPKFTPGSFTSTLHQVTNTLINENQVICMEDLNVKGMMKNHKLAESISEMNFGEFRRMLEYKAKRYDGQWACPQCGEVIERDYDAALNVLGEGLRILSS